MRLWSLHPKYLDCKGLLAVWREGLLARRVLLGQTRGYKSHPQLDRFRGHPNPVAAIDTYLFHIWQESVKRCYRFDRGKIGKPAPVSIMVTDGQMNHELGLLRSKTGKRDPSWHNGLSKVHDPEPNPVFRIRKGGIGSWERPTAASLRVRY